MNNDNSKLFLLVLLGLLTAFGPFVTDMYLPTLPAMTDFFRTSSSMVQMGLTTSMIGLAAGQLLFGPLSDKYGRRTPLLTAMWLFIGSTLLCIFASDIRQFIAARFLQGIAGSGGIVISRSVATDRFGGRDLARMLALIGAVNGVAPVVAPIIGGTLTDSIGWQGIFCILLGLGCLLLAGCFRLRESLPAERRSAVAIGGAAAFSIRFRSPERSTRTGCAGMLLFAAAEAAALGLGCGFWVYEGVLFGLLFVMGLTFTSSTALAMESAREHAGTASALLGAVCFSFGGIVSPLVGIGDTLLSTGAVFVACALCSWLSLRIAPRPTTLAAA